MKLSRAALFPLWFDMWALIGVYFSAYTWLFNIILFAYTQLCKFFFVLALSKLNKVLAVLRVGVKVLLLSSYVYSMELIELRSWTYTSLSPFSPPLEHTSNYNTKIWFHEYNALFLSNTISFRNAIYIRSHWIGWISQSLSLSNTISFRECDTHPWTLSWFHSKNKYLVQWQL